MENIQDLVREAVAKLVAEKKLTAAEKKKKEDIVMGMKKSFKGDKAAMYAIATDKAKKLAEDEMNEETNNSAYKKGEIANNNNIHYSKNPYPKGSKEYDDFYDGWMNVETEKQMQHDNETFRRETGGRYDESQQELDEFMIRRWQHYAGIK